MPAQPTSPDDPTHPHPATGGKTVWTTPSAPESEADETIPRHTTGGKTIFTASSSRVEDADEMVVVDDDDDDDDDDAQESHQRAITGGKTVMPMVPMPSTQSTETDLNESMEDDVSASESMDEEDRSSDSADEETILSDDASTSIRADLEQVLSGKLEFTGTFAFRRTYSDAPNPALHIDGLGTVGLPLSLRDAAAIKAQSSQAPFGMADRTVINKSVRDTWEIDAKQVKFRNDKGWSEWLRQVVKSVCEALGVNHAASQPRCELYKLLLYETGSHFLPHVDTEKQDGMFATIVIVLPSEFTGGAVRVSHSGLAEEYDCSSTSLTKTTVLAWYTDVMHEVKPVTSGYRLALSFNLLHTTTSLRPALGGHTKLIGELRRVLLSWKRLGEDEGPQKLICLLEHKYSQANLRGSALKGADAHRVSLLDMLARALGFHLGLASIVYHESGYGDDDGGSYYNRRDWYHHGDDDDEEEDVGMAEVTDSDIRVENLVDLNGLDICDDLEYEETETIPRDLEGMIADGDYDEQEYEGYMGNGAGSLERWYRRTALVIWPSWSHFDIVHGENGLEYACKRLGSSTSPKSTREERELAEIVVSQAKPLNCERVMKTAGKAARTWRDLTLWLRLVKACDADSGMRYLGEKNVLGAIEHSGLMLFDRRALERAFQRDTVNLPAFKFLDHLEEWTKSQKHTVTMHTVMQTADWASAWRTKLLESLKPLAPGEVEPVLDIALRVGGVELLERSVLPQIRLSAGPLSILRCAGHLHGLPTLPQEDKSRLVYGSIHAAIAKSDFYGPAQEALAVVAGQRTADQSLRKAAATTKHALLSLNACFAMGHEDLIPRIITKLTDFVGTPAAMAQQRAKDVLLPIINELLPKVQQRGPERPIPDMKNLCDTASALYMDWIAASPTTLTKADLGSLFNAVECTGEPGAVLSQIIPRLEGLRLSASGIRSIIEELQQRREVLDPTGDALDAVLKRFVQRYSSTVPLDVRSSNSYGYGPATTSRVNAAAAFSDPFDFCARMDVGEACCQIVSRLVKQLSGNHAQLRDLLYCLIPDIKYALSRYGRSVSSPAYAPIFRDVLVLWVDTVLGRRPASEAATTQLKKVDGWKCACQHCREVRTFLREEPEKTKTWGRIGYRVRQHLEKELGRYCWSCASWKTVSTTPQGISVTKGNAIYEPTRWRAAQLQGLKMFESITSDTGEMQAILGDDYLRVASALGVKASAPPLAAAPPAAVNGSTPAARQDIGTHGASTSTSKTSTDGAPPPKRRKTVYDEKEVIDLTSD
ncbi:hypothetical protein C8T65DRAFT_736222 [Cerioporus squamosus]|nr:hypothetical protein C8T65DRAFT_736222 [Cerioporus squamosus]